MKLQSNFDKKKKNGIAHSYTLFMKKKKLETERINKLAMFSRNHIHTT